MSTTETKIGKHDILCSSLNFATPEGAAKCDCNLSVMAELLEALEQMVWTFEKLGNGKAIQQARAAIEKARGIA